MTRRRLIVRTSPIHGRGLFALCSLRRGEVLLDYKGEVITAAESNRRANRRPPDHTVFFLREDGKVIDACVGGNSTKYVNHSKKPNCEFVERNGKVWLQTLRHIGQDEELTCDYRLTY